MLQLYKIVQKKRWLLLIPLVLTMMFFYLFDVYDKMMPKEIIQSIRQNITISGFLVHTPGCRIPDLDPFDIAVKRYYHRSKSCTCDYLSPLIESNQTSIWVVKEAYKLYRQENIESFHCCYTPFWRKEVKDDEKYNIQADDSITYHDTCFEFVDATNVYHEYVMVTCKYNQSVIYTDFHAFVLPKKPGNLSSISKPVEPIETEGLNIMIIGMDAVSRLNLMRQMPNVTAYIKSLKGIEFLGYNKVHDNTFPNLVPLLSGYSVNDIKNTCWYDKKDQFDLCPWIWKDLNAHGYLTGFGEDATWMGLFNYLKNGFLRIPTDYYLRPYMMSNENVIGHHKNGNANYCCGARFCSEVLFDYALKIATNMTQSGKKFWGFYWESSLTHDFLNFVPNAETVFYNLLSGLEENGIFEKTAVFFMSDHGMRWGEIRETFQGRMEERLPFLFVLLPDWFKEKYSMAVNNLRRNSRLLTTHYDVHETMRDLMDLKTIEAQSIRRRMQEGSKTDRRGTSLFLQIPVNRTCPSASIPDEWCTCHESKTVPVTDQLAVKAAKALVNHLNDMLKPYTECAQLTLKLIHWARIDYPSELLRKREVIVDCIVVVSTTPGDAKFEATVRYRPGTDRIAVQGFVSRINTYGTQSSCIHDYRLKLYCYCW